jgi:hypothetical protein
MELGGCRGVEPADPLSAMDDSLGLRHELYLHSLLVAPNQTILHHSTILVPLSQMLVLASSSSFLSFSLYKKKLSHVIKKAIN